MLKRTFHFLVRNEFYRLISFIFILFIIKKESRSNQKSEKTYKLLFLNKEKFRGDIEALSKNIQYDIFSVSNTWTCRLLSSFKEGKIDILQYHNMDSRDYGVGPQILRDLYANKIILLTNNPKKRIGLIGYGIKIIKNVSIEIEPNNFNKKYLETKRDKMGHEILKK